MKRFTVFICFFYSLTYQTFSQNAPAKFNYQAVARNASGKFVSLKTISAKIGIYKDDVLESTQVFTAVTNQYGLFSLQISTANVDWSNGSKFIQVDIDTSGGTNYQTIGKAQLLSVPYALYANNAGSMTTNPLSATLPLTISTGGAPVIALPGATSGADGYLKATDWTAFNAKIGIATPVAGDMVYFNGASREWTRLPIGASGSILLAGLNGIPYWAAATTLINYSRGIGITISPSKVISARNDSAIWNANKLMGKAIAKPVLNGGELLQYNKAKDSLVFLPLTAGAWGLSGNSGVSGAGFLGTTDTASLRIRTNGIQQMIINRNGNVAIGGPVVSTAKMAVYGNLISGTISSPSDIRYKKNITAIENALARTLQLQGVNYDWKTGEFPAMQFSQERDMGLIAQEVEKVFPELVLTDEKGFKSVRYTQVVAVLVEAVKAQQKEIEKLQINLDKMNANEKVATSRIESLESASVALTSQVQMLMELAGRAKLKTSR